MDSPSETRKVNVGCGSTPTLGWNNYDNSITVWLAKRRILSLVLTWLGILTTSQSDFIRIARARNIAWADGTKRIPLADGSVEALYACHVLEHLEHGEECKDFLREARRVLVPGGIIRIVVPDLRQMAEEYVAAGDADAFMRRTLLAGPKPKTLLQKLRYLLVGDRHHLWMYDGPSIIGLLGSEGFEKAEIMPPGRTGISDPGELDLREREEESVYVEASSPSIPRL